MPDPKTILFVEAQSPAGLAEAKMLEQEGYALIAVDSGEKAMQVVESGRPIDLILMDIDLGKGMDGTETAREILKDRDIPVIFRSSLAGKEIVEKTEKIISYGYVGKTSGEMVLIASIQMAFKLHEAHRELRKTKDVLEESERKYRRLFEAAKDGILILSADTGLITDCNPFLARLLGYSPDELIGKYVWDIGPLKDIAANSEAFLKLSENEYMRYDHLPLEAKDGRRVDVEFVSNVYSVGEGKAIQCNIRDITGHKAAAKALAGEAERVRDILESISDAFMATDNDLVVTYFNRSAERMLNRQSAEMIGRRLFDVFPEAKGTIFEEKYHQALQEKVFVSFDTYFSPEPDPNWYNVRIYPGKEGISAYFQDITDRRRSEEVLRAIRLQLSAAMDLALVVYWEFDPVAERFVFNDPFYAFYGTTAEREGGYRMTREEYAARFIHPDDRPRYYQFAEQNTSRPDPESIVSIEHRIIRRDGEVRHILARSRIVKDASGRIVKRYGANQDITQRKQMEEAVQESEERFRKMFEGSPLGMVMTGADFRFIRVNAAFSGMLGYTEQELTLLTFMDITHPEHVAEDVQHVKELVDGKIPLYRTEKRYIRKDKEVVWGSSTISITRDRDGRFLYFLTTVEDITQRKQSEEEKRRLESQLYRAQKMEAMGTLAGGVAHDFNNILTVLAGYAALLKMKMNDTSLNTYVDQILSASEKATDLVQSLLAFSRQQAISLKPVSLHGIIKGTAKLLKRLVTEDIAIKTFLAPEGTTIMADATQIDQILFNLATNARDAMPQGGTLTIETKVVELDEEFRQFHGYGEPGRYVLLSVSDTGLGMDQATRERVFDPFFTTKEVGKGTGLGLSTVYGIVKQHNGYITMYSEPNMGTTFYIYLPAAKRVSKEEKPAVAPVKGGNETILVAEDNEAVRGLIIKMLTEHGYTTIAAIDGADAIEQFKKADKIDLLILDSVMPRKNGRQAYDAIHEIKPDIRVIFTSGYTRDVFVDKGIEDENFNFLQKPISPPILLGKVRDILDDRRDPPKGD